GRRRRRSSVVAARSFRSYRDLVGLDQRVGEELLAHALELGAGALGIPVLELEVDDAADARLADRKAKLSQRALHRFTLGVEHARLRPDKHGRSHASTT